MDPARVFRDRRAAGRLLAERLRAYAGRDDVLVLALPRGGVPVGYEIALALRAPLDVFVVRKLGVPGREELALGAIGSGDATVLNRDVIAALRVAPDELARIAARERRELARRNDLYRDGRPYPPVAGRTLVLVDDGVATGASMLVALEALRALEPARVVVAVPVGARETCAVLRQAADELVCLWAPAQFGGVGAWYADFTQVRDDEVRTLLSLTR